MNSIVIICCVQCWRSIHMSFPLWTRCQTAENLVVQNPLTTISAQPRIELVYWDYDSMTSTNLSVRSFIIFELITAPLRSIFRSFSRESPGGAFVTQSIMLSLYLPRSTQFFYEQICIQTLLSSFDITLSHSLHSQIDVSRWQASQSLPYPAQPLARNNLWGRWFVHLKLSIELTWCWQHFQCWFQARDYPESQDSRKTWSCLDIEKSLAWKFLKRLCGQ